MANRSKASVERKAKRDEERAKAEAQAAADALVRKADVAEKPPVRRPTTRAEAIAEQRELAEMQAEEDAKRRAEPIIYKPEPGDKPTLHQLNAQAKALAKSYRDEAREAANAAGKAVNDVLVGRKDKMHRRYSNMVRTKSQD